MDIEDDINNIRSIYDTLDSIIVKYDEDISYFEDNNIKNMIKLLSNSLYKFNEDHQISIDRIKLFLENISYNGRIRRFSDGDDYNLDLLKDINGPEEDDKSINSNSTNLSLDSYEDLYGDGDIKSIKNSENVIDYNSQSEFIDSDNEKSSVVSKERDSKNSDNLDLPKTSNSESEREVDNNKNINLLNEVKPIMEKQKTNNGKNVAKIKEEFINNTIDFSEIILYRESTKLNESISECKQIKRLNNYLDNISSTY